MFTQRAAFALANQTHPSSHRSKASFLISPLAMSVPAARTLRSASAKGKQKAAAEEGAGGAAPVEAPAQMDKKKSTRSKKKAAEPQPQASTADSAVQQELDALKLLVRQQAEAQAHLQAQLSLVSSSAAASSPPQHTSASAAVVAAAASAAAAAHAPAASRKKEPRLSDLADYDGAAADKLDTWLDSLQRCADYYEQSDAEAVRFAVAHLRDTAYAWWRSLDSNAQAAVHAGGVAAFALALRARFQPITTERVARQQLDKLVQGNRHINEYIADFGKLRARIPSMSEADALYAFERGLRSDVSMELRKQKIATLRDATELAAYIGGVAGGAQAPPGRFGVHQMDASHGDEASLDERISRAVLNAMHARDGGGVQTQHHGYTQERERGGRGGARGGRGGRFGQRSPPVVPGVPEQVVRARLQAQQCVRCGGDGHRSTGCPNAISALGN